MLRGYPHSLDFFFFLRCNWQYFVVDFLNILFVFLTDTFLASSPLNCEIWTSLKSLHSVNLENDEPLWSWWKSSQFDIPRVGERLFIYFNSTRISLGILDNWSVKINFQSFWKINIMIFIQFYSSELSVLQKICTIIYSRGYISLKNWKAFKFTQFDKKKSCCWNKISNIN